MCVPTKIASLNLCLGLRNKKEEVKRLIIDNDINVLCLQETEVPFDFPINLLTFKGFNYESESNLIKSRCGMYVSDKISYVRRNDLEKNNMHLMIIDINDSNKTRLINVYRPFNPPTNQNQLQFFQAQLELMKSNTTPSTFILGDFNLDQKKIYDHSYSHKNYFASLDEAFSPLNLIQLVRFPTWSRTINGVVKESMIDHIYISNPYQITNIDHNSII